jgi:flagellar protein FliO/FliZ
MQVVTFFLAFLVVLALIGAAAWLVRRFAGNRLGANTNRGRMPRLAVIDAAAVDGRRRLVLVRRDNIEHLLMIGGPTDIVVEANIVRAMPSRDQMPSRTPVGGAEPPSRIAPLPDSGNWTDGDSARPDIFDQAEPQMPEPPPRPARPSFVDEVRRPMPPVLPERRSERSDPLTGFAPESLGARPEPRAEPRSELIPRSEPVPRSELIPRGEPIPRTVTRNEPMIPRPPRSSEPPKPPPVRTPERPVVAVPPPIPSSPPVASPSLSAADQNLAEMAQRLEAALRRPAGEAPAEPRIGAPPVAPEAPAGRSPPRSEPSMAPPVPASAPAPAPKSGFENLEDEMASLLGRPKTPS